MPAPRPTPSPPVEARPTRISVTAVDNLARDPYSFYARHILGLPVLDPLSALPDPRWRGTRVHALFEEWVKAGATRTAFEAEMQALRDDPALDPLAARFWLPRIEPALRWAAAQVWGDDERDVLDVETRGQMVTDGVTLHGKADRIDGDKDGNYYIVDYKSGQAPSAKAAADGLDNQLGLLGLMAREGFMEKMDAAPVMGLEYWSLSPDRKKGGVGKISKTHSSRTDLKTAEDAIDRAADTLTDLADRYLRGTQAFSPGEKARYGDYDQLMRRDEWFGREETGL
jgi:ATP-dependent helicase/nuclease subunit B